MQKKIVPFRGLFWKNLRKICNISCNSNFESIYFNKKFWKKLAFIRPFWNCKWPNLAFFTFLDLATLVQTTLSLPCTYSNTRARTHNLPTARWYHQLQPDQLSDSEKLTLKKEAKRDLVVMYRVDTRFQLNRSFETNWIRPDNSTNSVTGRCTVNNNLFCLGIPKSVENVLGIVI